jgi:hypothetical protein
MRGSRRWIALVVVLAVAVALRPRSGAVSVTSAVRPQALLASSAPPQSMDTTTRADSTVRVTTPAQGSKERSALLTAVRQQLKTSSRFKVDHVRVAGRWAFLRATEVVPLEGKELQETDLSVAALLERRPDSPGWRVTDYWTLPGESERPLADFRRRVQERLRTERLPAALLPGDL